MKKTFITTLISLSLAASASAATAATWNADDLSTLSGVLTIPSGTITDTAQGDFSVTAVLDASAVKTALTSSQWGMFLQVQDTDANENYSFNLALNGSSSSTADGIWTGLGASQKNQSISDDISKGLGAAYAAGATYTGMAITMSIGASGTNFYLTLVEEDGSTINYTGATRSGWHYDSFDLRQITFSDVVTYIALDEDVLTGSAAFGANSAALIATGAIPEPATTTLSLLALAGLAARRRRK